MAVFNILNNTDWDSYDALAGGTILRHSGRSLLYVSDTGFKITLHGSGFTYDALGIPTSGTITDLDVVRKGVPLAQYTGLSTPLTDFATLGLGLTSGVPGTTSPDMSAIFAVLRDGDDVINANDLSKSISGYDGNDTIFANGGDDWMSGGRGVDSYFGGTGLNGIFFDDGVPLDHGVRVNFGLTTGNIVDDGYGNTETATDVQMAEGTAFGDRFTGGAGNNAFYGLYGDDTLIGGDGDDILGGGFGLDVSYGGNGVDTLSFIDITNDRAAVRVILANPFASQILNDGWGWTEYASGIENVVGSNWNDALSGDDADNTLWGEDGADGLGGRGGQDILYGGEGNDGMDGGDGNDSHYGGLGNDSAYGGYGDDYMEGGAGIDSLRGGFGFDAVGFWNVDATGTGVTVNLYLTTGQVVNDGYGFSDSIYEIEQLEGSRFDDNMSGGYADVVLLGLNGADTLLGGHGNDTMYGGLGNDVISGKFGTNYFLGGKGHDNFFGEPAASTDILAFWDVDETGHGANVNLLRADRQVIDDGYGNTETATGMEYLDGTFYNDRFIGSATDNAIWGNSGSDTLFGDSGADGLYGGTDKDTIFGGIGLDVIVGGTGSDALTGGADADYFDFMGPAPGSDGVDTITDFAGGQDGIVINVGWASDLALGSITAAQFRAGAGVTTATTATQRLIYNSTTGNLYFDADGNGGQAATLILTLTNHAALTWDRIFTIEPF